MLLISSHEKAFTYTAIIVISVFVNFEVIIFISFFLSQSIRKFGTRPNQLKFDNLLDSAKFKSKGTYSNTYCEIIHSS